MMLLLEVCGPALVSNPRDAVEFLVLRILGRHVSVEHLETGDREESVDALVAPGDREKAGLVEAKEHVQATRIHERHIGDVDLYGWILESRP